MSIEYCKTCGKDTWTFVGTHTCQPCWDVWRSDEPRAEAKQVYANDSEYAVEQWAEKNDEDEVEIASGSVVRVYAALVESRWNDE